MSTLAPPQAPSVEVPRRVSQRSSLLWLSVSLLIFVAAEAAIFRSGLYAGWIEPDSQAGQFESTLRMIQEPLRSNRPGVLVVGDSRIAEGFSSKIANSLQPTPRYEFVGAGIPGLSWRSAYYLIRDADPTRRRFHTIVLAVDRYSDRDDEEDMNNRLTDMATVVARLRLGDIIPFASSYHDLALRREVFLGSLFKGIIYKRDVLAFLNQPKARLKSVPLYRKHATEWNQGYAGKEQDLEGLTADWQSKTLTFPAKTDDGVRNEVRSVLFPVNAAQKGSLKEYRNRWLGGILDLYAGTPTQIVFICVPRGPLQRPSYPSSNSSLIDQWRSRRGVTVWPESQFDDLQQPGFFADGLHLNKKGRELFSERLARAFDTAPVH